MYASCHWTFPSRVPEDFSYAEEQAIHLRVLCLSVDILAKQKQRWNNRLLRIWRITLTKTFKLLHKVPGEDGSYLKFSNKITSGHIARTWRLIRSGVYLQMEIILKWIIYRYKDTFHEVHLAGSVYLITTARVNKVGVIKSLKQTIPCGICKAVSNKKVANTPLPTTLFWLRCTHVTWVTHGTHHTSM